MTGELMGFAYGEDLAEGSQRSLGFRLLEPVQAEAWSGEVEALARRLQAAPYSDHWPATDLFCSVLLADGRRVVAMARYGLSDHTATPRRGGLELIGVVGPASLDVPVALAIYRWLQQRRARVDNVHGLGGPFRLSDVLAQVPPAPPEQGHARPEGWAGPVPVLPVRLWQDGAFLFAASTPADPDHHLRLLEVGTGPGWQWLPLVGPDFPLPTYAQRGPLVAWTPHLAGVALKLDRKSTEVPRVAPAEGRSRGAWLLTAFLVLLLLGLLGGNVWYLREIQQHLAASPAPAEPSPRPSSPAGKSAPPKVPSVAEGDSRERFVAALHQLLIEKGAERELTADRESLLRLYEKLAAQNEGLRVRDNNPEGKRTVAALSELAGRNAERIEASVRKALTDKGFSEYVIDAACKHVREQYGGVPSRR